MQTNSDYYKADLAEYSYNVYEQFLHRVFMDRNIDIPERFKTLFYCFLHKGISFSQMAILYGNANTKKKATSMVNKRLKDKGYLIPLKNLKSLNTNMGDSPENTFLITAAGIRYTATILEERFPEVMPELEFQTLEHTFTLEEVLEYLSDRCTSIKITYWNHYLASRDVNTYLLASPFAHIGYRYEIEVGIDDYGVPISLYTRLLYGVGRQMYSLRSDAILSYPVQGDNMIRLFIELDTGSQSSSLLTDKVCNYRDSYLMTNNYSPESSLLFCLHTKVDEAHPMLNAFKGSYGTKDYYYLISLESTFDLLQILSPSGQTINTIGEALSLTQSLESKGLIPANSALKQTVDNVSSIPLINMDESITKIRKQFNSSRNDLSDKRAQLLAKLHQNKYVSRRSLLHKAVNRVEGMEEYYLKGFSFYSLPNHNIDGTFPFLLPEMFQFKYKLKRIFQTLNMISPSSLPLYQTFYPIGNDGYVLRNSYVFEDNRLHIIIENVSDDLGGFHRIRHLLDRETVPTSLLSTKVICLIDDEQVDTIKENYLSSKLGTLLSSTAGSRCELGTFEIIFASYDTIRTAGSLFTFATDGSIIYKHH